MPTEHQPTTPPPVPEANEAAATEDSGLPVDAGHPPGQEDAPDPSSSREPDFSALDHVLSRAPTPGARPPAEDSAVTIMSASSPPDDEPKRARSDEEAPNTDSGDPGAEKRTLAAQMQAIRHESKAALKAKMAELAAKADQRVRATEDTARADLRQAIADVSKRYEGALAAARGELEEAKAAHAAQLEEAEARCATLERKLAAQEEANRSADPEAEPSTEPAPAVAPQEPLPSESSPALETKVAELIEASQRHETALADLRDQVQETQAAHAVHVRALEEQGNRLAAKTPQPDRAAPPSVAKTVIWTLAVAGPAGVLIGWLVMSLWFR